MNGLVLANIPTSHEQYYYKIGLHWHHAMHGDSLKYWYDFRNTPIDIFEYIYTHLYKYYNSVYS